ncbi:MAG: N-acetylmuramoyl-L-alanine amidase [Bacteroidales bacterium]|nr:N-acetylmuramoyl-L-alanine amidase [Bacteroidales bacterium]
MVPEFEDIPLPERVRRVNVWCRRLGKDHVVLVSIHVNASGSDGQWHTATGWSCYTSPGQTAGDRLAECLYRAAEKHLQGHKIRTDYSVGVPDGAESMINKRHGRSLGRDISERFGEKGSVRGPVQGAVLA